MNRVSRLVSREGVEVASLHLNATLCPTLERFPSPLLLHQDGIHGPEMEQISRRALNFPANHDLTEGFEPATNRAEGKHGNR